MKHRSKFRLTVPQSFYDAVCDAVDADFAGSYLPGATLDGQYLRPRTLCGWRKMADRSDFIALLKRLQITMVKPTPFPGNGDRLSAEDLKFA